MTLFSVLHLRISKRMAGFEGSPLGDEQKGKDTDAGRAAWAVSRPMQTEVLRANSSSAKRS